MSYVLPNMHDKKNDTIMKRITYMNAVAHVCVFNKKPILISIHCIYIILYDIEYLDSVFYLKHDSTGRNILTYQIP